MKIPKVDLHELLKFLNRAKLTLEEYVYLYCMYNKLDMPEIYSSKEQIYETLQTLGYLDPIGTFTSKALFLFSMDTEWIEEWRSLFPRGIKQGSHALRGDKEAVMNRMVKFMKTHNYTKEQVIGATKRYLKEQEKDGFRFTKVAHYLIEKDGISTLASLCEAYIEGPSDTYMDQWIDRA